MPSEWNAPGLKTRKNANGTIRVMWVARADLVKRGYMPKTVRLHYDINNPLERPIIESACLRLQSEMLAWAAGCIKDQRSYDGTLGSLIRCYQTDDASPYRQIKWNTRRTYDQTLKVIEKAFGKRSLSHLGIHDFRRWYDEAKKPKHPGGEERLRKASGIISMLRRLFSFGVMIELKECSRLQAIMVQARFKQPGSRKEKLEPRHIALFIQTALAEGRFSLALGTAIQFETTMRQRDVIGEWAPVQDKRDEGGIVLGQRRWCNGLTWADISADFLLVKDTTKTGATVAHDLTLIPRIMELLQSIPEEKRVGPIIIDEKAGRPYAEHAYTREWRIIAQQAGIPDNLWNMDARAGGITEADDAGAKLDYIRSAAGHTQVSTTVRYVRGSLGKSRNVAELRQAHRNKQ